MKPIFRQTELPFDSIICLNFRTAQEISYLILTHYGFDREPKIIVAVSIPFEYYSLPVPAVYLDGNSKETAYHGIKTIAEVMMKKEKLKPKTIIIDPDIITKRGDEQ